MRQGRLNNLSTYSELTPLQSIFYGGNSVSIDTGIANADGVTATSGRVIQFFHVSGVSNAQGLFLSVTRIQQGQIDVSPSEGLAHASGIAPTVDIVRTSRSFQAGITNAVGLRPVAGISPVIDMGAGYSNAVGFPPTLTFGTFTVRVVDMQTGVSNANGLDGSITERTGSIWTPIDKVTNNVWSRA